MQTLLFPDPRPLVERLGADFFRQAPRAPGVYLMRDGGDAVIYVGKARDLRKRLASYRVANPDRLPRRQLRLLRAVARIELRQCADEADALSAEAELLKTLRPRFNRAGTWAGPARFLGWRVDDSGVGFLVQGQTEAGWNWLGPLGAGAVHLRSALVRLLWGVMHPQRGLAGLPAGWFRGRMPAGILIPSPPAVNPPMAECGRQLEKLFSGRAEEFCDWIRNHFPRHPIDTAMRDEDLDHPERFAKRGFHHAKSAPAEQSAPLGN
jgi:predicted GIY-YIG superfamily endonuclease